MGDYREMGILFSTGMARAVWDGRKDTTRRLPTSPLAQLDPGDRLYVRESWQTRTEFEGTKPRNLAPGSPVRYVAGPGMQTVLEYRWGRLRPGIFLPRWASRLTLVVREVEVSWLHELDETEARREGFESIEGFKTTWNALHNRRPHRWADNPTVAAIRFTVFRCNINDFKGHDDDGRTHSDSVGGRDVQSVDRMHQGQRRVR